jgi:hypothetical protein
VAACYTCMRAGRVLEVSGLAVSACASLLVLVCRRWVTAARALKCMSAHAVRRVRRASQGCLGVDVIALPSSRLQLQSTKCASQGCLGVDVIALPSSRLQLQSTKCASQGCLCCVRRGCPRRRSTPAWTGAPPRCCDPWAKPRRAGERPSGSLTPHTPQPPCARCHVCSACAARWLLLARAPLTHFLSFCCTACSLAWRTAPHPCPSVHTTPTRLDAREPAAALRPDPQAPGSWPDGQPAARNARRAGGAAGQAHGG